MTLRRRLRITHVMVATLQRPPPPEPAKKIVRLRPTDVVDPPTDVVDPPTDVVDPPTDVVDPPTDVVGGRKDTLGF